MQHKVRQQLDKRARLQRTVAKLGVGLSNTIVDEVNPTRRKKKTKKIMASPQHVVTTFKKQTGFQIEKM